MMEQGIKDLNFKDLLEKGNIRYSEYTNARIKCGIIGQSGSGKSTLINAILGEDKCDTGVVETTLEMSGPYDKNGLSFYDLPGAGTIRFKIEDYIEKFNLKQFDFLILVTSNRFYENDLFLLKELSKIRKKVFIVRTKIDAA